MNVEVKIVAPELAQALNNLAAAIAGRAPAEVPSEDAKPEKPTRARAAAKNEKTEPDTPATSGETATSDTSDTASDQENAGPALDYETDIKAPFLKLAAEKGRDAAVALLVPYKASSAQGVPEDKWPEFIEAINAASLA